MPTFCKNLLSLADQVGFFLVSSRMRNNPIAFGTDDDAFGGFEGSGIACMQITIKHVMHVPTQAQSTFMASENKLALVFRGHKC